MAENIATALAELQAKLPRIKKAETAEVKSAKGTYSYSYADLADVSAKVLPLLGSLGLSFTARPTLNAAGTFVLAYELLHVSGDNRTGEYPLPTGGTPQSLGSAITYGRRYCLCAITGVAPDDDDDGAAASATRAPAHDYEQRAAPEPQPEPVTDEEWATGFEKRVDAADSEAVLKGLYGELNHKCDRRECTPDRRDIFVRLITMRKNELEGAPE